MRRLVITGALVGLLLISCSDTETSATGSGGSNAAGGGSTTSLGTGAGSNVPKCDPDPGLPHSDPLVHLGRGEGDTFIEILDVVQDHPTVYACTSVKGLNVWDASSAAPPVLLASRVAPPGLGGKNNLAHCQHVALDTENQRLAITNRGDEIQPQPFIGIFDVSDPSSPSPLGTWIGSEAIEGVVLRGDRIYAAAHGDGIIVFQGSQMGVTELGRSSEDADSWQPVLYGDHLLVADGVLGLSVYSIEDDTPVRIASLPIDGSAKDVVVAGDVAYVAASSRIAAVDVSDPTKPALLGELETDGTAVALALGVGDTLLVAEWEKLRGYDVSDPANMVPELSQVMPTSGDALYSRILTVDAAPDAGRVYGGEWAGLHAYTQTACGVGPDIETTPDQLSFATIPTGSLDVRAVIVRNNGNRPLQISDIDAGHVALSVSETSLEIEAGDAAAVEVTFEPSGSAQMQAVLTFTSNDLDQNPFELRVSGNVPGIDVGDPVPAFNLTDTDGNTWSNADLAGNVAVLAYFATF